MTSSLQFLMSAMTTLKRKNPLTESFLVQLDLDLEGTGIDVGIPRPDPIRAASVSGKNLTSDSPLICDNVR